MTTIDLSPSIRKFRDTIIKDVILKRAILWGPNDRDARLRIHFIVSKLDKYLLFDPAYTAAMQRDDITLQQLCGQIEEILSRVPTPTPLPTPEPVQSPRASQVEQGEPAIPKSGFLCC